MISLRFLLLITFAFSSTGCATLDKWAAEQKEKERLALIEFKKVSPILVSFYDTHMLPLSTKEGKVKPSKHSFKAKAKLNAEKRYIDITWSNEASLLITGHLLQERFNQGKFLKARRHLLNSYKRLMKDNNGTVTEEDSRDYRDLTPYPSGKDSCSLSETYIGHIKENVNSAFLVYTCKGGTIGSKSTVNTYKGVRIIDGSLINN